MKRGGISDWLALLSFSNGTKKVVEKIEFYNQLTLSLPRVTLWILVCLTPDDFTRPRETPWE